MKKSLLIGLGIATLALGGAAFGAKALSTKDVAVETSATDTKTLYLCVNWNDWANPKIHYWGGSSGTSWESLPTLTACEYSVISDGNEGVVYSYEVPTDITHFLITKNDKSAQTANFDLGGTWGAYASNEFYFVWEEETNKVKAADLTFLDDGYYIAGDAEFVSAVGKTGTAWKFSTAVKMDDASVVGDNHATYVLAVGEDDIEFKCIHLHDGTVDWLGSNLSITDAGNYGVYVNGSDATSFSTGVYIDAFTASFLGDMQDICGTSTAEWEKNHAGSSLNTVWAKHKARFEGALADGEAAKFVTSSGVAGVARGATLYLHCVSRYSLSTWTNGPAAASKVVLPSLGSQNNSAVYIVIAIASFAAIALGGLFCFRKKKEK
ncbi:MAG: hypothetical protein K6E59_03490 [Bacilli bacterium]|nr:hypothetical protein [Bacilli bacterium]